MDFSVYGGGAVCGALTAAREGLYWALDVRCRAQAGVVRLYACAPDGARQSLGVLMPEGGELRLRRRVSASALPLTDGWRFTTDEREPVTAAGVTIPDGVIETQGCVRRLFVPYDEAAPFILMEYVCFFTIVRRAGRFFWTCALDENNTPVFVDNPAKCDTILEVS